MEIWWHFLFFFAEIIFGELEMPKMHILKFGDAEHAGNIVSIMRAYESKLCKITRTVHSSQ